MSTFLLEMMEKKKKEKVKAKIKFKKIQDLLIFLKGK
jgi:hypothetical protein